MKTIKIIFAISLLALLMGCGSGEESSAKQGAFSGQIISGLTYKVGSQTGKVDESGSFSCEKNNTISFYAGDILLSSLKCKESINLFDLAQMEAPIKAYDIKERFKDKSIYRLINLASFLQTIDVDGDHTNGIEIPEGFKELSQGVTLDFSANRYIFKNSFSFRKLLYLGQQKGIWEKDRTIVKGYVAMDALYADMSIVPEIDVIVSKNYYFRYDESEEPKLIFNKDKYFSYEENKFIFDEDSNGFWSMVNSHSTYQYNVMGVKVLSEIDKNNNGVIDFKRTYDYDKYGNQIMYNEYMNSQIKVTFDDSGKAFYDYSDDTDGSMVINKKIRRDYTKYGKLKTYSTENLNHKLANDIVERNSYDKFGNRLSSRYEVVKSNGYKEENICYQYKYNASGMMILDEDDFDCDGSIDRKIKFTYDDNNRQISRESYGQDEKLDDKLLTKYNTDGNRVDLYYVYDESGVNIYYMSQKSDKDGRIFSTHKVDYEGDGVSEINDSYTYTDSGKVLSVISYHDGVKSYQKFYSYDESENLLTVKEENILEEKTVYTEINKYDEYNNLITLSKQNSSDYNESEKYTYDEKGNILTHLKRVNRNGHLFDFKWEYSYEKSEKWLSFESNVLKERD